MKGYWILKADGTKNFVPTSKKPTLKEMQAAVGGYIQPVSVDFDGRKRTMIVNEEGKIVGLPVNELATKIYQESYRYGSTFGMVVGDVLVLIGYRL